MLILNYFYLELSFNFHFLSNFLTNEVLYQETFLRTLLLVFVAIANQLFDKHRKLFLSEQFTDKYDFTTQAIIVIRVV